MKCVQVALVAKILQVGPYCDQTEIERLWLQRVFYTVYSLHKFTPSTADKLERQRGEHDVACNITQRDCFGGHSMMAWVRTSWEGTLTAGRS